MKTYIEFFFKSGLAALLLTGSLITNLSATASDKFNLTTMSEDMVHKVMPYLTLEERQNLAATCTRLRNIVNLREQGLGTYQMTINSKKLQSMLNFHFGTPERSYFGKGKRIYRGKRNEDAKKLAPQMVRNFIFKVAYERGPIVGQYPRFLEYFILNGYQQANLEVTLSPCIRLGIRPTSNFSELGIHDLISAAGNRIRSLKTNYSHTADESNTVLFQAFASENCVVGKLEMMSFKVNAATLRVLSDSIHPENHLTHLNLSNNSLGDAGTEILAEIIINCPLLSLNICRTEIGADGASYLATALSDQQCTLRDLRLRQNPLKDAGAIIIASSLAANSSLTTLDLGATEITGTEFCSAMPVTLAANKALTSLDVGFNQLNGEAIAILAPAILRSSVRKLDLWNNQIGDEGANAIAAILKENCLLETLRVEESGIGTEGGSSIAIALRSNSNLVNLHIGKNSMGDPTARELITTLGINETLRHLYIDKNQISSEVNTELYAAAHDSANLGGWRRRVFSYQPA